MYAMIVNKVTGECIEWKYDSQFNISDAQGMSLLRGYIRMWMNNGLAIHDFDIMTYSSHMVWNHLRDYAWKKSKHECDICAKLIRHEDTVWFNDSEDVCMLATCKECVANDDDNDDEFNAIVDELENFDEDEDLLAPTDEDIAEWQGHYE
jgi:hypothetical protein